MVRFMGRYVPDLGRKLALLKREGPYKTTETLAAKMGVAVSTLNGYVTGTLKSPAESVPERRLSILISLFEQVLPATFQTTQVRALVLGDVNALEETFRAGETTLLEDVLKREARRDT